MMNLKYYLRGLGIGIIVTALIMSIAAGGKKETLSDEEIRERARALGMTESGTLLEAGLAGEESSGENEEASHIDGAPSDTEADDKAAEAEKSPEMEEKPNPEERSEPEENPDLEESLEPEENPNLEESLEPEEGALDGADDASGQDETAKPDTEGVTIQVKQGDGSYSICKKLEEVGLISSATEFDTFLCERGYDKKIRVGTFQIPGDADPEQIARILNGLE